MGKLWDNVICDLTIEKEIRKHFGSLWLETNFVQFTHCAHLKTAERFIELLLI